MDLPLPYPQLEHLVGEDRRIDYGGPRSDLELALLARDRRSKCSRRIQKGLGGFRAAHNEFPLWRKSHRENLRRSAEARNRLSAAAIISISPTAVLTIFGAVGHNKPDRPCVSSNSQIKSKASQSGASQKPNRPISAGTRAHALALPARMATAGSREAQRVSRSAHPIGEPDQESVAHQRLKVPTFRDRAELMSNSRFPRTLRSPQVDVGPSADARTHASSASIAGIPTTRTTRAWTPTSSILTIARRWC